eukprot:366028-Amphidinium_carterae.1
MASVSASAGKGMRAAWQCTIQCSNRKRGSDFHPRPRFDVTPLEYLGANRVKPAEHQQMFKR